jgi:hypothetical protein
MNALTLLGLFLATIVAVSCGPHHPHHRRHHAKQVAYLVKDTNETYEDLDKDPKKVADPVKDTNESYEDLDKDSKKVADSVTDTNESYEDLAKDPERKPTAHSHTLKIQHQRIPAAVRAHLVKNSKTAKKARHMQMSEELQRHLKTKEFKFLGAKAASDNGSSSAVPLENFNDWLMVANITIGTPPQLMRVGLSEWDEDMIVLAAGGDVDQSDCGSVSLEMSSSSSLPSSSSSSSSSSDYSIGLSGECDDSPKNTYDVSQSSTATVSNVSLNIYPDSDYGQLTGVLVNDVVNIGGLDLNLTLGDSDDLGLWIGGLPIDGVLGLSPSASLYGIPNVLQQLVGQLAQPLLVLNTHRDIGAAIEGETDDTERNELTIGTDQVDGCSADFMFTPLGLVGSDAEGGILVTSVSSGPNGSVESVDVARSAFLTNYLSPICCSIQLEDLIINATGAQMNQDVGWYTTPCDQVSQGQNVNLNHGGAAAITLTPADLHVQVDGVCYLYVVGWYDESDSEHADEELLIGQQHANNHCVAYNIANNMVGVSDKVSA